MAVRVKDVLDALSRIAPLSLAEEWDNVGLLVGDPEREARRALVALDLTGGVLREAAEKGCDLVVTHHPILFRGTKRIVAGTGEGDILMGLIRGGISHIAMHTNYDAAEQGVNDCIARRLGVTVTDALPTGMRAGRAEPMPFAEFQALVDARLFTRSRAYGDGDRRVSRIAILGGSGGSYAEDAARLGADVFLTGEIGYHTALDLAAGGVCVLEAGHYETEKWAMKSLADRAAREMGSDSPEFLISDSLRLREMEE